MSRITYFVQKVCPQARVCGWVIHFIILYCTVLCVQNHLLFVEGISTCEGVQLGEDLIPCGEPPAYSSVRTSELPEEFLSERTTTTTTKTKKKKKNAEGRKNNLLFAEGVAASEGVRLLHVAEAHLALEVPAPVRPPVLQAALAAWCARVRTGDGRDRVPHGRWASAGLCAPRHHGLSGHRCVLGRVTASFRPGL